MPGIGNALLSWIRKIQSPEPDEIHFNAYTPSLEVVRQLDSLALIQCLRRSHIAIPFRPTVVSVTDKMKLEPDAWLLLPNNLAVSTSSVMTAPPNQGTHHHHRHHQDPNPSPWKNQFIRDTLYGPNKIEHAVQFSNKTCAELIHVAQFGHALCGHPSIMHGGFISSFFDDAFGMLFALAGKGEWSGFTANLNVNYRAPMPAGVVVAFVLWIDKTEGRKVFLKAEARSVGVEDVTAESGEGGSVRERLIGSKSVKYAEATALFIKVGREQMEGMKGK
ncbi:Thioesterase super member 4 [Podochytrium sp. JEL0797]|nr:Thioesterase super member 4 [Podochytrium sp. JEL0797]